MSGQEQPVDPQAAAKHSGEETLLRSVIAQRQERLSEHAELELPIPTWDGKMLAVYGHLGEQDYNRFVARLGPDPKPSLSQAQDILIASCKGVILLDGEERRVIADGYGRKLANRLAIENAASATAREVVLHMAGGRAMELAAHASEVIEFLQGASQEVEDEVTEG